MQKLPTFLMLIGIPGSGKTFWVNQNRKILDALNYEIISPDKIRQELTGDISDLSKDKIVWNVAKIRVFNNLLNRKNVLLDATNVNYYYRKQFIKNIPDCRLKAKVFNINSEIAKARVNKDLKNSITRSNVPEDIIDKMYVQFVKFCHNSALIKEGFEILDNL